uniref:hypothetical protein n=1 Tax=Neorhizobium sp. EC2-8 TaxID=3129230 RepID=UPI0031018D36
MDKIAAQRQTLWVLSMAGKIMARQLRGVAHNFPTGDSTRFQGLDRDVNSEENRADLQDDLS